MLTFKRILILWTGLIGLGPTTSSAFPHAADANQAFQQIQYSLQSRAELETGPFLRLAHHFKTIQRTCDPTISPIDYAYLTQELNRSLSSASRIWLEAESNPEISEADIRNSDLLIIEVSQTLFRGAPSRITHLIPEFQDFLQLDLRTKSNFRTQCLSNTATPLISVLMGGAIAALMPSVGSVLGGCLSGFGLLCCLFNSPRETFNPALPTLDGAISTEEAESLIPCPTGPASVCWPSRSEMLVRKNAADQLNSKLGEIAVKNVVEPNFLMLILANYYDETRLRTGAEAQRDSRRAINTSASRTEEALRTSATEDPGTAAPFLELGLEGSTEELPEPERTAPSSERLYDETCPICLGPSKESLQVTHCGHHFHGACLGKWMKNKLQAPCPICRRLIY